MDGIQTWHFTNIYGPRQLDSWDNKIQDKKFARASPHLFCAILLINSHEHSLDVQIGWSIYTLTWICLVLVHLPHNSHMRYALLTCRPPENGRQNSIDSAIIRAYRGLPDPVLLYCDVCRLPRQGFAFGHSQANYSISCQHKWLYMFWLTQVNLASFILVEQTFVPVCLLGDFLRADLPDVYYLAEAKKSWRKYDVRRKLKRLGGFKPGASGSHRLNYRQK